MINEQEIKLWIARLETEESSWANYEKLAALYAIWNQNFGKQNSAAEPVLYSAASVPAPVANYTDSEFLRAVNNAQQSHAWEVMDELMDTLKITNERVYNSVMRKLE